MIRPLEEKDIEIVCTIVNENWKNVYSEYINPRLLDAEGCSERICKLKSDFISNRLSEYVWEEQNQVSAMLSFGDTADTDVAEAFEMFQFLQYEDKRDVFGFKIPFPEPVFDARLLTEEQISDVIKR